MERLFRAIVTFEDKREWSKSYVNMQIAPRGTLWWDPARSQQDNLWQSWVELGEDLYAAITAAPVPVDMRALRALKRSPLALELYAWLAHTAFSANRNGDILEKDGRATCLPPGVSVFAEFGEGVEGASPGDAPVAEGDDHGAEEGVGEEEGGDGEEEEA